MSTADYNDAVAMATQCRHHAVRTAMMFIDQGCPNSALAELIDSTHRCARLDHRPLDQGRVELRANNLLASWGNPHPTLGAVA